MKHLKFSVKIHVISIFSFLIVSPYSYFAQKEVFRSNIEFNDYELTNFYSALSIDSNQLYFLNNKWALTVYDKTSGDLVWNYDLSLKSNNAPVVNQNSVFVEAKLDEYTNRIIQLNAKTGDTIQTLKLEELNSQPFFKENTLFCTGLIEEIGGVIMGYDVSKNEILWYKYIGHGVSFQPYFLNDRIVVNYEGQMWFEIDYVGNALDKDSDCYSISDEYPFQEQFCNIKTDIVNSYLKDLNIRNASIDEKLYYYGQNETVVLNNGVFQIINSKNKQAKEIAIGEMTTQIDNTDKEFSEYQAILKVENNAIWFVYDNVLTIYDYKSNQTLKEINLNEWNPHQLILDGNHLWLISKNDGQMVGLEINF